MTTHPLQSDTLAKLAPALVKAQATMGVAIKDATGQIGQNRNYKYADLASVMNAASAALEANGLCVVQRPMPSDTGVCVQTVVIHTSGEWISDGGLHLPMQKIDPQGAGSSITYARRYGLASMLGIVQDDDDATHATQQQNRAVSAPTPTPAPVWPDTPATPQSATQAIQNAFDATPAQDEYTFAFGKHKGEPISAVPSKYLDWLLAQPGKPGFEDKTAEQHAIFRRELHRREQEAVTA